MKRSYDRVSLSSVRGNLGTANASLYDNPVGYAGHDVFISVLESSVNDDGHTDAKTSECESQSSLEVLRRSWEPVGWR